MNEAIHGQAPQEPKGSSSSDVLRIDDPQSLLEPETMEQYGLLELIPRGYGLMGDEAYLREQVETEYDGADVAFLYPNRKTRKMIGSLTYADLKQINHPNERIAKKNAVFWDVLERESPVFAELLSRGEHVLYTRGIVVHPEHIDEGIGGALTRRGLSDLNPFGVFGESKTPEAVSVRAREAQVFDHRTFVGLHEVTRGQEGYTSVHLPFVRAITAFAAQGRHVREVSEQTREISVPEGIFFVSSDYLERAIPMPNQRLSEGFQPIIKAQQQTDRLGVDATAVATVISVPSWIVAQAA